ncbi:class I SAM-dependent methyltransferase [Hymenobacter sp. ISL-91]|uniref:class I SAM-dependent methyltransferase n=1 Tax=Hymenobacter sp. ISL-91 TaxID=2819151 RepID=UPI001BE65790|nr:class I SAM-dependent methyltransferase [Hymenobacter sp. ISL-91]MBT2557941.1 class I SAM-dependent methyltransferase [Hymenobacter sp. ISL-91]
MAASLPDSGFDYVAAFYDSLARLVYGRALQRAQQAALAAGLPATGQPRVLVVGGGSGWVLGEVLSRCPGARILYLEASPRMLAHSRDWLARHHPQADQVAFRLGTEAALEPAEQFDVLITFFLLDLFEPGRLRQLVARLNTARAPDGTWLLADFGPPRHWWHRVLLRLMYSFFGLTTGISARQRPPIEVELARLGLRPTSAGQFFSGMVEASVWRP